MKQQLFHKVRHFLFLLFIAPPIAQAANSHINVDQQGIAIHGYDPVAYFQANAPRKGSAELSYQWSGATWLFSSAANRDLFVAKPKDYAPQFGGFCAYAASLGQYADINPMAWSVINNKLYLNFSLRVRELWRPRAEEFIADAEQLWPTMENP